MTTTEAVSPLEAIDLAYECPLDLPSEVRTLLARLARNYGRKGTFPSRERLAADLGITPDGVDKRLRKARDLGVVTSITVGSRRHSTERTFRILHIPGLPLVIPSEVEHKPEADALRMAETLAQADAQAEPLHEYPEELRRVRLWELERAHRLRLINRPPVRPMSS